MAESPRRRGEDVRWWERHGPRLPAQGIKARTQRGRFASTWWADRWIAALERLVDPGRLARGRTYARAGQVTRLAVAKSGVSASVQGSRPTPYGVAIQVTPLDDAAWSRIFDALAAEALYAAHLLAGEMPEGVEDLFATQGASLLPRVRGDLKTTCTCPDSANPCKHVAAVHYLLAERFDADPFLLFLLRGRDRPEILDAIRARRTEPVPLPNSDSDSDAATTAGSAASEAPEPALDPRAFWTAPADAGAEVALHFALPEADALPAKRLGPAPFVRDQQAFTAALEKTYRAIGDYALNLALRDL